MTKTFATTNATPTTLDTPISRARALNIDMLTTALRANYDAFILGEITKDIWGQRQQGLWDQVDMAGVREEVTAVLTPILKPLTPRRA